MGRPVGGSIARTRAAAIDARLVQAKQRFALAALACLRGAIDAETQVQEALQDVERARELLAQAYVDE